MDRPRPEPDRRAGHVTPHRRDVADQPRWPARRGTGRGAPGLRRQGLGPLLETGRPPIAALLDTLETFLACDGSWARTAQALHLRVNTVHYRVERIERLTGRDLSRLTDRLDLWAALLCR
ncbi:helix-turn-helix domain-containing protein [Streptomyces sp900105245]|uniref:PucR family transcriptional regulator n=1 Tax=Streptomyces sp. 900105245 TaxID=3154379 RepID=UPI003316B573